MTSQPGKQTIAIHILPNNSRSKGNQTKTFGQLIEHNMSQTQKERGNIKKTILNYIKSTLCLRKKQNYWHGEDVNKQDTALEP